MRSMFVFYSLFGKSKVYFEKPANLENEPYVIIKGIWQVFWEARFRERVRLQELDMQSVAHWFSTGATIIALVITAAVAIFLVCCLECTKCPKKEKDEIFNRHEL